jgi:carbon monoxide dehydrogenase subunit G
VNIAESIFIKAPASIIFEYLMDINKRKEYIPALEEVVMIDPLPIRKGSKYIEVAIIAGRNLSTTYEVTAYEKNRRLSAKTLKSIFPISVDLTIKEEEINSELIIALDFQLSGVFRLASGIVSGIVRQQAKDILTKVKSNIEF